MMKQSFNSLLALLALSLFILGCGPDGERVASGEADTSEGPTTSSATAYTVDIANSNINWEGTKFIGGGHVGTINIQEGTIAVQGDKIIGGNFTIDMTSLKNTDLPAEKQPNLEGHLKSGDFFDVENFPTAAFEVKNVVPASGRDDVSHMVTGNFTMKDKTRSITIPVMVDMSDGKLSANSVDFVINRTEWDVSYGSGILGTAQDEMINDQVGLQFSLVASK
ncbi:MAG: YceI family protein [Bacteroidota bacterium]